MSLETDNVINIEILKFKQLGEELKKVKFHTLETLKSIAYIEKHFKIIEKKTGIKIGFVK